MRKSTRSTDADCAGMSTAAQARGAGRQVCTLDVDVGGSGWVGMESDREMRWGGGGEEDRERLL